MGLTRRLLIVTFITAPPAFYVYNTITRLEAQYPRLDPVTSSTTALRTPADPETLHTPQVDVYGARVPARLLASHHAPDGRRLSPEEAWARLFLQSPALQLEGKVLGGLRRGAGDLGQGGFREGQSLLNGTLEVVRPPSPPRPSSSLALSLTRPLSARRPSPLLVRWTFPPAGVALCRRAAAGWGYPFRFQSGGRHELGLGEVDGEGMVEVRFASAHDYEWVASEGDAQKTIPEWTARLHRAAARWVLDERIRALERGDGRDAGR